MAKVNFMKEIKELIKDNEKELEFKGIKFSVKNYLPIVDKLTILELTIQNCIQENENGIKFYNSAMRECMLDYLLAKYYSSLAITDDWEKMYNILCESGLMEKVICEIPTEELDWYENNLDSRIEQEYSILERENQFGNIINNLVSKIEKQLPSLIKSLENFDPSKLEFLQQMSANLNKKGVVQ